jgi:hypothetical protein
MEADANRYRLLLSRGLFLLKKLFAISDVVTVVTDNDTNRDVFPNYIAVISLQHVLIILPYSSATLQPLSSSEKPFPSLILGL